MTTVAWSFDFSWGTLCVAGAALIAALWLAGRSIRREQSGPAFLLLELLRLIVIALLIVTLLKPERVISSRRSEQPVVAILYDGSGSMTTRDVITSNATATTRAEWLSTQRVGQFWKPLEAKYKVESMDFATVATNTAGATPDTDPGTDINEALEQVANRHTNLRGVILLSDGDWNLGKSPVSAATALAVRNVPVFPVTVGNESFLPDIELLSVSAPSYGLADEHVALPVTIRSHLPRDVKTRIILAGPGGYQTAKDIVIPAMSQLQDTIHLVPTTLGNCTYTLAIPTEKDEVFADNNAKEIQIAIRREILKVLVVDSTPRWEYRFLRNALARDPGISVSCLLLHPGMAAGEGRQYIQSFPSTREELSVFDVVFLGDVGIGTGGITRENAGMIKGIVEQQGSGLVFLPGILGNQASLAGTELGEMMPVALDPATPNGLGSPLESRLELTTRGRDHLLTMLASNPDANHAVWRYLPGFYWYAPVVRAKPGTDVLAVHATARNQYGRLPLLVTRNQGNGKVLFMGTDSAWRWRRGVEDTYHYRFWGQVVRWMAHQRHMAHADGIRLFFTPESPARGARVFLTATVLDRSGFPAADTPVTATLTAPSGATETLDMAPEAGGWGVFTGAFAPAEGGSYSIEIAAKALDRRVKTDIMVSSPRREQIGRPARTGVMREIALITRGQHGSTGQLADVVNALTLLPEPKPTEERFRLWCHPLWATLVIGLLSLYWAGRKLIGLI